MKKIIKKHNVSLIILAIVGIISLLPVIMLFREGFFLSDDGEWMVIRFSAFYQTLRDGQIPPRFFMRLNHGYGYPIGTFLYPAFMYLATPVKLLGFSFVESIKIVIIASFFFSGIGSYLWLRQRFMILAAVVGAIVYVYFPYHLFDFITRGSIGELLGFAVLPFLLLAVDKKKILVAALLYGLLILSHNTFAFLLTPFLLTYTYFLKERRVFWAYPLGLLVSAFFWLPSVIELSLTRFSTVSISEWQSYFLTVDNSNLVGIIGLVIVVLAGISLWKKPERMTIFFAAVGIGSVLLASSFSSLFWELGFLPKLVQFPWRLLILTVWASSFLAAYSIQQSQHKMRYIVTGVLLLAVIWSAVPFFQSWRSVVRDEGYYTTNEDTTTTKAEYMPIWVTELPTSHPETPVIIQKGTGEVSDYVQTSKRIQFIFTSEAGAALELPLIYYPGWETRIHGQQTETQLSRRGYIAMHVPAGRTEVSVTFSETPLRLTADILSGITIIGVAILLLLSLPFMPKAWQRWYNKLPWVKS